MTRSIRTHQLFFHLLYWALLPSPFLFSFQERKPETSCLSFASVASRKILLTGFTAPSSFAEVLLLLVVFFSSAGQFTFPKIMMNWQSRIWICYLTHLNCEIWLTFQELSIAFVTDATLFIFEIFEWSFVAGTGMADDLTKDNSEFGIKRYNWPFHSLGNDVSSY